MILKSVGQPLDTAKNYRKSSGDLPKGYQKASGNFKGYFKAAGKCPKTAIRQLERRQNCPANCPAKTWQFPPLFVKRFLSLYFYYAKVGGALENYKNA
jgi:hypothetical protein